MPPIFLSGGSPSVETMFDRFRLKVLAGVQDAQLRRYALVLLAAGAGLLPLMAGPAPAALQKVSTDGADTLLLLMGAAMVLLLTTGLAFFYGGFTRAKNVLNTMMMSFFLMGLIGVLWVVIGYSLSFEVGFKSPFIGGLEAMWLNGVGGPLGDQPLADGFSLSATSLCLIEWFRDGKPTAVAAATGAVAGLVGLTPAAGFVSVGSSVLIGAVVATGCYLAVQFSGAGGSGGRSKLVLDESLDAFLVDGVGGTIGALLTGPWR